MRSSRGYVARAAAVALVALALCAAAACDTEVTKHKVAGNMHFNQGDYPKAAAEYRQAVAGAPGDADARIGLGNALFELSDYDGARAEYEAALRLAPDHPEGHRGVMAVLSHTRPGDPAAFAEYLGHAEALLAARPKDKGALIHAAIIVSESVDAADPNYAEAQRRAEGYLRRALAIDDTDPKLLVNLAFVYARQHDLETALRVVDRIEAVQPGTGLSHYTAGVVYTIAGRPDDALARLDALLRVDGIDADSLRHDYRLRPLQSDPRLEAMVAAHERRAE